MAASEPEHGGAQEDGRASGRGAADGGSESGELVRVEIGEEGSFGRSDVGAALLRWVKGVGGPEEVSGIEGDGDDAVVAGFFGGSVLLLGAARGLGVLVEAAAVAFGDENFLVAQAESEREVLHRDEGDEHGGQGGACEVASHLGNNVVDAGRKSMRPADERDWRRGYSGGFGGEL